MKNILRKMLSCLTVLFVLITQIQYPIEINAEENIIYEVSLEIDSTSGDLSSQFDSIDRFNQYGIAVISKETLNRENNVVKTYGLINSSGVVIVEPIYYSIVDYNDQYFSVVSYDGYNMKEGLASKKDGQLDVPVDYSYIPFIQDIGIYNFNKYEVIDNNQIWFNELYSYNNNEFSRINLPEGVDSETYNLWANLLFDNVYQITAYKTLLDDNNNTTYINKSWLSNSRGDVIFDGEDSYISNFTQIGNEYFFTTSYYNQDSNVNKGGLYKLNFDNSNPVVTTILNQEDYRYVWIDSSKEEAEVVKVINGTWINSKYNLVTGWVDSDVFGTQNNTFSYWGNANYNLNMNCQLQQDNSSICSHYLSLASDLNNANLFGDKTYQYIMISQFDEYIVVNNSLTNKSNIFIKNGNNYFLALQEDIDGWIWIDENRFARATEKYIDLNGISNTILLNNERILNYDQNQYISFMENRFISKKDSTDKTILYDFLTQTTLLRDIYSLSINSISNGIFTGSYSKVDDSGIASKYIFIYDTLLNQMFDNIPAVSISSINSYGYASFVSTDNYSGLIYKDGTILISPNDHLYGGLNAFEEHFDNNFVIGHSINGINYYNLSDKIVTSYINNNAVIVSQNSPIYLKNATNQFYLNNGVLQDTSRYQKIGSFVNGSAFITQQDNIYKVDNSTLLEPSIIFENISDYLGAIVRKISDGSLVYYNNVNNTEIPLQYVNDIAKLNQVSEYIYEYEVDANTKNLIIFNKTTNSIDYYNNISNFRIVESKPEFYEFNYIKSGVSYKTILKNNGEEFDQVENGSYEYKDNYIIRKYSDNSKSILFYNGQTVLNVDNLTAIFTSVEVLKDDFIKVYSNQGYELMQVKNNSYKTYGNVNFENTLIKNEFYAISSHCEGQNINPEWDGDDYYSKGLVNRDGLLVLDPAKCYWDYSLNERYQLIEAYYRNYSNIGNNPSAGIMDYNGELISKLNGYQSQNNLAIADNGDLKILKPTNLKKYFSITNNEGVVISGYETFYTQNVFNIISNEIIYEADFASKSSIQNNKFYSIASISEVKLETEIIGDDIYQYSSDVFYNEANEKVRLKFKQDFYNLQNQLVVESNGYDSLNYDGRYFIANYSDLKTNDQKSKLINEVGEVIIDDVRNVYYDEKLGWYISYTDKVIESPYNPNENYYLTVSRVLDYKTNKLIPYYFSAFNSEVLVRDGYVPIQIYTNYTGSENLTIDSETKTGVLQRDGTFLIEPIFDNISEFTKSGNATSSNIIKEYPCTFENQYGVTITQLCMEFKYGLINKDTGIVLDTEYDAIESTNPTRNSWNTPNFDKNGNLLIVNYIPEVGTDIIYRKIGLANINGELFEGAVYQYAYFKNGYYYLKKFNGNWFVVNGENFSDVTEVVVAPVSDDASINSIEITGDYIIAEQKIYDSSFNKYYSYYGVLDSQMNVFIDFDYSSIRFEDGKFYLEIYNTSLGTTQQAVMNEAKEFIVPFNNKYDSLGNYIDGYAIGQNGTKEPEQTSANPALKLLNAFFIEANALNDEFVLEVINEEGQVVGDLSDEYESATLLGTIDGVTKALVKKDGKYYMATLVETPVVLVPISGIELSTKNITLNIGDSYNLIGSILPSSSNEPKRIEWSSLDSSCVSVDINGVLKALKACSTTIIYKVNDFEASASVTVKSKTSNEVPQDTVTSIVDTILNSNPDLSKNEQKTIENDVEVLIDVLNGTKNLSDKQLLETIQNVFELYPDFVSQLNDVEAIAFEGILKRVYADLFNLEIDDSGLNYQIDGLLIALNLLPLFNGEELNINITIKDKVSKEDEAILNSYIQEKNYDQEYIYSIDIEIMQIINDLENFLSELNRPITLTFNLPDYFVGVGELKVIQIHNGVVSELPVILNSNYTFSFTTYQFSSFSLVKSTPLLKDKVINSIEQKANNWILMSLFGSILILTVMFIMHRIKYK